jgi:hypothetical protein
LPPRRLPFRSSDRRLGFEHGDCSGFVAIAPVLVDMLLARQRLGSGACGFGVLAQDRLIVLELNNQMDVGGGGLKGFFLRVHGVARDNASGNVELPIKSLRDNIRLPPPR